MQINRLPPILIINLKRFKESQQNYSFMDYFNHQTRISTLNHQKDDTFVDFPVDGLDMTRFVKGSKGETYVYDLYAVSNHSGTLSFGHYTAICKNPRDGKWYNFNDSHWSATSNPVSSQSLVLFYRKRELNAIKGDEEVPFEQFAHKPDKKYL